MFPAKAFPRRSSWRFAAAFCAAEAARNPSPADVLQKVNRQLYPDIKEDMFISMAYLILDHARNGVTPRARRARRAVALQTAVANRYADKIAGNGRRN